MDDPRKLYGSAKHPDRPVQRARPEGLDDATVAALGKLSKAFEVIENARGLLYQFHRMSGTADLTLQEAIDEFRKAGHEDVADTLDDVLVGRDVLPGMWTFQIVDAYDETYYSVFRGMDEWATDRLASGTKHLYEAEMKKQEQGGA
jgi:hypothetical protein